MSNSFSNSMMSSTVSSESAPKSPVNEASAVTSDSGTPNLSTMMLCTRAAMSDITNGFELLMGAKKSQSLELWCISPPTFRP